jgi:ABC-type multidrug transport system ATPase subunit/pSer/pThr/pTyr-binding forkhead associated (FHA) protein
MFEETILYQHKASFPHLTVISGHDLHSFQLNGEQTFGRISRRGTPDLWVHSGVVSRNHGVFVTNDAGCRYTDTGSMNGTLCCGSMLTAGEGKVLSDGDILRIHGKQDLDSDMDVVMIYSTAPEENRIWRRIPLADAAEVVIGRNENLRLREGSVSRRHASLFRAKRGWALLDHGSLNGVYLNGARIEEPVYLQKNDVIRIADYYFVFLESELLCYMDAENPVQPKAAPAPAVPEARPVNEKGQEPVQPKAAPAPAVPEDRPVNEEGLSVWIEERNVWQRAKKKTLLRDIRLNISSGSMVLILGGSGAGKTTFMNAVMGYEPAEGQIRYKGTDIYKEYEQMKYEIGYVPQEDLLRKNDSVYDTLLNAARMRLPVMKKEEYEQHVEETLHLLGLERLRDSLVVKLSGGQRKRLSIAVEYVGNPSLFFLDEPDSGLDGTMARQLWENLRAIADQGKIVMVISHSPDRAFKLFDKIIVLAKDDQEEGRLVYYGSPRDACTFFEVESLEEIVQRINYPEEGGAGLAEHYIRKYEESVQEDPT